MSYNFEKNENGGKDIVISGWENGIAASPLYGHEQIINVDVVQRPGFALCQYKSELASDAIGANAITEVPKWIVKDPGDGTTSGKYYSLSRDGKVHVATSITNWDLLSGNTLTNSDGQGLAVFVSTNDPTKRFLFVARKTNIDVYDIAGAAWTNGWKTLQNNNVFHPMYVATDRRLYIGNVRFVASVQENDGVTFDPGNAATYTFNAQALDLPPEYNVRSLSQLGVNLMVGTQIGKASTTTPENVGALIFPWDKTSDSFGAPIDFNVRGVNQQLTINNITYVWAGIGPTLSLTNGSSTQTLQDFLNLRGIENPDIELDMFPCGIASLGNEEILIGIGYQSSDDIGPLGVYSYRNASYTNASYTLRNLISTGEGNDPGGDVEIGSIKTISRNKFFVGWKSSTSQGIDIIGNGDRYEDYSSTIDTDLIPVSTFTNKAAFSEIEFKLGKPLNGDEGIRISYRTSLTQSFTLIGTWTGSGITDPTYGDRMSYIAPANITRAEYLQLRIQMRADGTDTPWLSEVRIR